MPIPKPKDGETKPEFISRCISQLKNEDPDRPNDQIQAICFDAWKKSNEQTGDIMTEENVKEKKYDEDGRVIVAENVKVTFSGYLNEAMDANEDDQE